MVTLFRPQRHLSLLLFPQDVMSVHLEGITECAELFPPLKKEKSEYVQNKCKNELFRGQTLFLFRDTYLPHSFQRRLPLCSKGPYSLRCRSAFTVDLFIPVSISINTLCVTRARDPGVFPSQMR